MFRIYDGRTKRAEPVGGARPGRLGIYLARPLAAGPARLGDLRACLIADLIRRVAELHQLWASAWLHLPSGAAESAQVLRAACDELNIYPLELTDGPPEQMDVVITAPGTAAESGILCLVPGDTSFTAQDTETAGASKAAVAPRAAPGISQASLAPGATPGTFQASLAPADLAARELDPLALRLAFLTQHYRAPMGLGWQTLDAADQALREWRKHVADWARSSSKPMSAAYLRDVLAAFDDDLGTPAALDMLRALAGDGGVDPGSKFETFAYLDRLLGLDLARDVGH